MTEEKYDRLYEEIYRLKKAYEDMPNVIAALSLVDQPDHQDIVRLHEVMTDLLSLEQDPDVRECLDEALALFQKKTT
jgi:hypothetical protein